MKKLLSLALLIGSSVFGQVSIGIQIGPPPPPRVLRSHPRSPGPGFVWIDGYWYPVNGRYAWHKGYYTRPPFEGAIWVAPRHDGRRFFEGHWEAAGRQVGHDHRWDRDKRNRDYNRDRR
jgi:hypothetical protein